MPPIAPKSVLETYFQTHDEPTAAQFATLINSTANLVDDRYLFGLRDYDPAKEYKTGDAAIFTEAIYQCVADTTGPFNPVKWQVIAFVGSVVYNGSWDTQANNPALQSSVGTKGFYYVVTNASANPSDNTTLNGINNWVTGDWAIFNGTIWQRVNNSQVPVKASDVIFIPYEEITADRVQLAMQQLKDFIDNGLAASQPLLDLTPSYYPFASGASQLSDGVLANVNDGIAIDRGMVFRSAAVGGGQLNFGPDGAYAILQTSANSKLAIVEDKATLQHELYGTISIARGVSSTGELEIEHANGSCLSIDADDVRLMNARGATAYINIAPDSTIEVLSQVFRINSATINVPQLNASTVPYINASKNIISSAVTPAELGYLSGVTSAIQAQINSKQASLGFTPVADTTTVNGHALNADVTVIASEVPQDSSNRFVTDGQIASWDAKQPALGYIPVPNTTTVNGHQLTADVVVTKADVLLGNVPNVDTTNPANIFEDASHRFVTDTEKTTWNNKQNALGFTPVPNTRTVNGHQLTADVVVTKTDLALNNVTNDRQLSLKVDYADETSVFTSGSSGFATVLSSNVVIPTGADGDYLIEWYYEIASTSASGDVGSRVSFNGSIVSMSAMKPGVATVNPPRPNVDYFTATGGFIRKNGLTGGSTYVFLLELNRPTNTGTALLRRPRYTITRL